MTAPYLRGLGEVNAPGAVVVLGCGVGTGGELRGAALRRVIRGGEIAQEHASLPVLVSGGRRWGSIAEATAMARGLVAVGVHEARIRRELTSLSTRENAGYSGAILRSLGISRIILVTCDFHLSRARGCFEKEGFVVDAFAAESPRLPFRRAVYRRVRERLALVLEHIF